MTRRDVPYAVFVALCMVVTFMSGRYSVGTPSTPTAVLTASAHHPIAAPIQRVEFDRVVPVEALPTTITPTALPENKPPKIASKPVEAKPLVVPVVPEKIDLEEDPLAVANPYKIPNTVASTPGF